MVESNEILNVLMVRDDRSIVQTLESELPFNYRILAAQNGAEAKERLTKSTYQIIICDEQLPDTTGTGFLAETRKSFPHTVRILVSSDSDADSVIKAIDKASIFKYLINPQVKDFEKALADASEYYLSKSIGMYTDSLTQLKSKEVIFDMLEMELHRSQRYDGDLSAIMLQVVSAADAESKFASETDTYLLKDVADIVQAELRTSDVAGRLNDNSCLVLLNNANRNGVTIFKKRLSKKIDQLKSEYKEDLPAFEVMISIYSLNGEKEVRTEDILEKLLEMP